MINAEMVKQIVMGVQKGVKIPRSSIQLAKGFTQAMRAKYILANDDAKVQSADNIIKLLSK